MPKSIIFISDIHLSENVPPLIDLFIAFLEGPARDASAIYILGDWFDVWVGEDLLPAYFPALRQALSQLKARNIELYFIAGNRDFLISTSFLNEIGVKRLKDQTVIDLFGTKTLLMHGDILCTQDKAYQLYRKFAQHPLTRRIFLMLPRKMREKIAQKLRHKSREYQQDKPLSILDVDPQAVETVFAEHQVEQLIHGHVHRPKIHILEIDNHSVQRLVLGDWKKDSASYIQCTPEGCTLATFLSDK